MGGGPAGAVTAAAIGAPVVVHQAAVAGGGGPLPQLCQQGREVELVALTRHGPAEARAEA